MKKVLPNHFFLVRSSDSQELLWEQIIDKKKSAAELLVKLNEKKIEFSRIWYGGGED